MIQSIVAFILAIVCYCISQLQQHGKLKWMKDDLVEDLTDFWGENSDIRKYKTFNVHGARVAEIAPNNWYYRLIKSKYKERWFTSTWLTVNLTDGYHACQSLMFLFMSFGISHLSYINFFIVWPSLLVVFSLTYRVLQR